MNMTPRTWDNFTVNSLAAISDTACEAMKLQGYFSYHKVFFTFCNSTISNITSEFEEKKHGCHYSFKV